MNPTYDVLAACCDDTFTVRDGADGVLELVLVRAEEGPYPRDRPAGSLTFRGPAEPALRQGTLDMSHPDLGEFALFVVPVGHDESGTEYQAVFS